MLICREICFVAIYAALAQNLFCRNLRAFVWRKIYSKIVLVEKKGQISGMVCLCVCVFVYTQVTSERLWDGVQLWSLVWGEGGGWGGEAQPPSASVTSSSSQALWAHAFHTIFFRFNHELCVSLAVRNLANCQVGLLQKPPLSWWQAGQISDQWYFSFKKKSSELFSSFGP